jgi:hypothetical protein
MGYFRNAEATAKLFFDDWLDSGDYAYLHAGDVYLTGRAKDIIIKAGRNIYPQEIERAVGDVEGGRTGGVAVFGSLNEENGTERLVVMAETRTRDDSERLEIRRRIEEVTSSILGAPPDDVHLVDAQAVLKTSSGKIRRDANRIAYETGADSPARRAIWMQIVRLGLSTVIPKPGGICFCWLVVAACRYRCGNCLAADHTCTRTQVWTWSGAPGWEIYSGHDFHYAKGQRPGKSASRGQGRCAQSFVFY